MIKGDLVISIGGRHYHTTDCRVVNGMPSPGGGDDYYLVPATTYYQHKTRSGNLFIACPMCNSREYLRKKLRENTGPVFQPMQSMKREEVK